MSKYIIPALILLCLVVVQLKKVNAYKSFTKGAKESVKLIFDIFPFLVAIIVMVELINVSGLALIISDVLSPVFKFLGMPPELCQLVLIKPFTGSGSLALLNDIFVSYGADSYIGRCASVIMGSSETVFYVATIYVSKTSVKKLSYAIPVALFACFMSAIVSCLLCRVM